MQNGRIDNVMSLCPIIHFQDVLRFFCKLNWPCFYFVIPTVTFWKDLGTKSPKL